MTGDGPLNLAEWEAAARAVMDHAAFDYVAGGAGDEITLDENRAAFARLRVLPRMLRAVGEPDSTTTVLGSPVAAPVMVAPMAYQGAIHPAGDRGAARAAAAAGLGMCLSSLSTNDLAEVAEAGAGAVLWFQLYPFKDAGMSDEVVARAREGGFRALVVTVDVPTYGIRERDIRSGFSIPGHLRLPSVPMPPGQGSITPGDVSDLMKLDLGWDDIERFVATSGLPLLVKGLLRPDDAERAIGCGAAGVIVSNHGGRQLDTVVPTIEALPRIAETVGDACELYLDSGVRRGTDVLKAIALGARAVLIGRPVAWANGAAGEAGVATVLAQIVHETRNAMTLAGCATLGEVDRHIVRSA